MRFDTSDKENKGSKNHNMNWKWKVLRTCAHRADNLGPTDPRTPFIIKTCFHSIFFVHQQNIQHFIMAAMITNVYIYWRYFRDGSFIELNFPSSFRLASVFVVVVGSFYSVFYNAKRTQCKNVVADWYFSFHQFISIFIIHQMGGPSEYFCCFISILMCMRLKALMCASEWRKIGMLLMFTMSHV